MRTYKDIEVKYYDTKGDVHVRCSVPVTEDALVHFELMQSHYCKLSFKLGSAIYFKMGDFIVTDYGRFELVDNVKPKDDGNLGYSYELEFDAYYRKWKNKRLKYMPNSGSPEGTFTLTSNIITHANIIKDNLDFLAKASKSYLYDPNYTGKGSDYTFVVDASVDSTKSKVITYSNSSILDAIANIAQTFECEWWVEGNLVHFGTCENTNEVVDFKDGENIVSMSSSQSQASYANRVYAFGAARNLPSGYKQNSSADVTKNGVVEKRLMLPTLEECSAENKKLLEDNGFELKNGCLQVKGLTEDEYVEGVTTNDDIYPRNLIKTSNVTYYEKDVEDESTPEEGDYIKRTFYRVKGLTIVDADGNKTGDMAFRSSYILSGKTLHIIFQSGSLNGMDFECQFNPDGESEILRDSNGSPILKDGKEQINPAAQVFEIVANEDYGRFLPDTVLHPKDGDTFVLYNWDSTKLGNTLVTSSANELLTDAIKNLKKSMIDPTTYTCTAASDYSYNDGKGQFHFEGDRVNLFNKGYDMSFRASRIIGYELHLDVPFDSVKYTVGEKPAYSRLNAMSSQIEELVFNGQSYLNKGGSGNSIYIIKSYDTTVQPTDFNVFSAKRVENSYLHKDKTDAANFLIKFLRGLQVGDYSALSGGDWSLDELFRSHLTTDYLNVRMKAIFETLEILHTDTLGGELFITPVGSNRILKVEEVNITYDGVSQKAYRCYFLGEQDGSKVENKWKVGDQARSKSFNLTAGKYHNVGNHYYWRLVIGVSSEAVEIDGKKYHYVDLSDIDKDAASDEPMVDDILNQCGNRTDITRQSCLVFSAVDTYSPCITLYHGVDGYTFNNKEYVNYGVNHSTNKAFFHVYGDMYFGDRPTSANNYEGDSYVKYDSDKKKVTIKGDLDIKSTYDGKTLDKYITEKSLDKNAVETIIKKSETITDLQNQIDGAIETWFYDGVPTLSNAPAIGWTTDKDKKTHLGDLYYDNKTGKAYRFAKDDSTYKWIIIKDTELTKALEDSRQALKDAKSKRRIFGSQPVPPYDVNDMWVNATYPSDGSTYKNEILKCSTSKAEGEEFDIADWKLASKYTDDTKAEEAKKAAEKAQAEIKNTQTNLIALGTTVSNNKKAFDVFTSDGYLDSSEIAAIAQDSKRLEDDYNAAVESYNNVVSSKFLLDKDGKDTTYKTDLVSAKAKLDSAKNELITYLSDIVSRYNASDSNGKATIKAAAAQKYTNFTNAYKAFYDKLGVANNYITSNLFDGLNTKLITNMAGLEYIKAALVDGDTVVKGGLILSTLIALRNDKGNVTAGINGADTKENGIALWLGGKAIDKQASTTTEEEKKIAAKSLLRFDGTGYFANGNLWWDVDGTLHADPTSFIINKNNVGVQLALFAPVWKSGTTDTTKLANVLSIDPQKPFTHLDVSGNVTTEGSLKIGGIYLSYDSANNALRLSKDAAGKEAANFYATGGITAYGAGASTTGGGGGLNGSVKSYSNALKLTSESLSEIASAYSIKALDTRISSLEGGSAMGVSVSGSGNAVTAISKSGTTIIVTKGTTFLTSHQSLDGYVNAISVSGSGNAITSVSKSGKGITFTKGATFLTSHQSLANYYTKSSVDSLLSGKSATSHTHSVIINGTTKIIAASGGTAVNLGTYLTSHQSLADYAKKTDIPTSLKSPNSLSWSGYNTGSYDGSSPKSFVIPSNTNQLTNGAGFITSSASISGNAATATKVNHSLLVFGKSFNGSADVTVADTDLIASISTGTSNVTDKTEILTSYASDNGFNDSNAKNKIHRRPASAIWGYINSKTISNADKLDNVHLNGIFTALSNTNNGVSMTIGTVAKSLANMQVYSATKLVTARNISIAGRDFVGNVNFDGTGNVSLNGAINYCTINIGNTDPNPFKRIAHIKVARSWNDNALLLYISQGYNGGNFGLCRVEFRTNDIANSDTAGGAVSLRWLIRQGYATDSIQAGYYIHLKNAYVDVFLKTTGAYQGTVIRVIQDSRGSINNSFGLINSTYNTEAYTSLSAAATALYNVAYQGTVSGTDTCTVSHANSATKLQTPRTIWGQGFDGTGNVDGTLTITNSGSDDPHIISTVNKWFHIVSKYKLVLYAGDYNSSQLDAINILSNHNVGIGVDPSYKLHVKGDIYSSATIRTAARNQAIMLTNDANPAWISALDGQIIFNTGKAIRFGETAWEWNQWAGLKYNHSDKTIYLGIAEGSVFEANSVQNDGTLKFPGITTIIPNPGARIGGSGGNLYLGNANNSGWVCTQDICSQTSSSLWSIRQDGNAYFNSININSGATFNGSVKVNNMLTARAIMFTTADVNAFGTSLQNWDGSIGANVTNMFNGIERNNISLEYSANGGSSWITYTINPNYLFNLINDNSDTENFYLGSNAMNGNSDADKLAQIKRNQLRVTIKIPPEVYQELAWISVDVNNGVDIKCQVYFGNSNGVYTEYVSKVFKGWSHRCDICIGPSNVNVGNDTYRYVRLVFSHLSSHTALRNGIISRIRALALTKYNNSSRRYNIGTTGHIYNYDYNMNTYFPNSILAEGGVTAYQSSDIRLKQDLRKLDYFGIIKAMGGTFGFAWKKDNTRSIGWIAQHVLCNPHLKDIVETDEKGYYKINYWSPKLIATAFGAIEQVGDEVSRLKARVVFLESEVQRLSGDKDDNNKKSLDNKNINLLN